MVLYMYVMAVCWVILCVSYFLTFMCTGNTAHMYVFKCRALGWGGGGGVGTGMGRRCRYGKEGGGVGYWDGEEV